jgi:hypothetical protein
MMGRSWTRELLVLGLGGLLIAGCAAGLSPKNETPGQRFDREMKVFAENCAKAKLKPNDTACDILKLKPADPLATEEGRFAHSLKIPNPVPEDSGYKPGMTPQEYFDHLCKSEAGEFIYKTVENVEGLYMMRPWERAADYMQEHLYAMEDPYGYTDAEAVSPEFAFVHPNAYRLFETSAHFEPKPIRGKQFRHPSIETKADALARYVRFHDYDGHREVTMKKEYAATRASHYGYVWRGIARPHDRELGIAGGELIVMDLEKNEVLGVKRGFIRSGGSGVQNLTGIWWPRGQLCSNDKDRVKLFPRLEFIKKVLKPKNVSMDGADHATN